MVIFVQFDHMVNMYKNGEKFEYLCMLYMLKNSGVTWGLLVAKKRRPINAEISDVYGS